MRLCVECACHAEPDSFFCPFHVMHPSYDAESSVHIPRDKEGNWDGFGYDGQRIYYDFRTAADRQIATIMQLAAKGEFARMRETQFASYAHALISNGMSFTEAARVMAVSVGQLHAAIRRSDEKIIADAKRSRAAQLLAKSGWGPVLDALRSSDVHVLDIPQSEDVAAYTNRLRSYLRHSHETRRDSWAVTREGRQVTICRRDNDDDEEE